MQAAGYVGITRTQAQISDSSCNIVEKKLKTRISFGFFKKVSTLDNFHENVLFFTDGTNP